MQAEAGRAFWSSEVPRSRSRPGFPPQPPEKNLEMGIRSPGGVEFRGSEPCPALTPRKLEFRASSIPIPSRVPSTVAAEGRSEDPRIRDPRSAEDAGSRAIEGRKIRRSSIPIPSRVPRFPTVWREHPRIRDPRRPRIPSRGSRGAKSQDPSPRSRDPKPPRVRSSQVPLVELPFPPCSFFGNFGTRTLAVPGVPLQSLWPSLDFPRIARAVPGIPSDRPGVPEF